MSENDRDAFLKEFARTERGAPETESRPEQSETAGNCSLVGFCVIGGIFSEGIDLTGKQLIGAVVVGTGVAQISTEGELLKDYFEKKGRQGYDYAYRFPGINKVFQAAGRVIRTAEDRGVVILLDNRMLLENHVKLFPMDWDNYQEVNLNTIGNTVKDSWGEED